VGNALVEALWWAKTVIRVHPEHRRLSNDIAKGGANITLKKKSPWGHRNRGGTADIGSQNLPEKGRESFRKKYLRRVWEIQKGHFFRKLFYRKTINIARKTFGAG